MSAINNQVPIPAALVAANATPAERAHFKFLWQKHLNMRQQFKIIYYLPQSMGEKMGLAQLVGMADNLRNCLYTNVYVHFDSRDRSFRVGQVTDKADCDYVNQTVLLHTAVYTPPTAPYFTVTSNGSISGNLMPKTPNGVVTTNSNSVISNTRASRRSNSKAAPIPKPRNSWVIYRQDKHDAASAANPGMHNSLLSKVISAMWRNESTEVRHFYYKRANEEKFNHKRLYPGYKCQPRKSSEIKKRNAKSKEVVINQPQAVEAYMAEGVDSFPSDTIDRLFNDFDNVLSAYQSADVAGDATADLINGLDNVLSTHQSADVAGDATADLFNGLDNFFAGHQAMDVAGAATPDLFSGLDNMIAEQQAMDVAGAATEDLFDFPDAADWAEIEEMQEFSGDFEIDLSSLELPEFSESLFN